MNLARSRNLTTWIDWDRVHLRFSSVMNTWHTHREEDENQTSSTKDKSTHLSQLTERGELI